MPVLGSQSGAQGQAPGAQVGYSSTPVTLKTLIEETLDLLYRPDTRPAQVYLGPTALDANGSVTSFTVTNPSNVQITVPCILENGWEQMLVTAVSTDATPVYTVSRGYAGTPFQAGATGAVLIKDPQWGRYQVRRNLLRGLRGTIFNLLPAIENVTIVPTVNQYWVAVPADCIDIVRMSYLRTDTNSIVDRFQEIDDFEFHDFVSSDVTTTQKLVTVPPKLVTGNVQGTQTVQTLYVTYLAPYSWSGGTEEPLETETVNVPLTGRDLAPLYAAAYCLGGREMTRLEIDNVESWSNEINFRTGNDLKLVAASWQAFYRRLDEARRMRRVPRHRTFRKMRRTQ